MNKLYIVKDDITYLFYISEENGSDFEEMAAVGLTAAERNKLE